MRTLQTSSFLCLLGLLSTPLTAGIPDTATAEMQIKKKCAENTPGDSSIQAKCIENNTAGYKAFVSNRAKADVVVLKIYDMCQSEFGAQGSWDTATYCAKLESGSYYAFIMQKKDASPELMKAYTECERRFGEQQNWHNALACAFEARYDESEASILNGKQDGKP